MKIQSVCDGEKDSYKLRGVVWFIGFVSRIFCIYASTYVRRPKLCRVLCRRGARLFSHTFFLYNKIREFLLNTHTLSLILQQDTNNTRILKLLFWIECAEKSILLCGFYQSCTWFLLLTCVVVWFTICRLNIKNVYANFH